MITATNGLQILEQAGYGSYFTQDKISSKILDIFRLISDLFDWSCVQLRLATQNQKLIVKALHIKPHEAKEELLVDAGRLGNLRAIALLVSKGVNLSGSADNSTDQPTPLLLATQQKQYSAMKMLVAIEEAAKLEITHTHYGYRINDPLSSAGQDLKALKILLNYSKFNRWENEKSKIVTNAINHKPKPNLEVIEFVSSQLSREYLYQNRVIFDFMRDAIENIKNENQCIAVLKILKKYCAFLGHDSLLELTKLANGEDSSQQHQVKPKVVQYLYQLEREV